MLVGQTFWLGRSPARRWESQAPGVGVAGPTDSLCAAQNPFACANEAWCGAVRGHGSCGRVTTKYYNDVTLVDLRYIMDPCLYVVTGSCDSGRPAIPLVAFFKGEFSMSITVNLGEAGSIVVDESKFVATVHDYIFNYGLKQMLNDVHAGETAKKTADDDTRKANKLALVEKKLASLYAGEVAQAREGGDPLQRTMRELAEKEIKAKIKAAGKKVTDFTPEAFKAVVKKHVEAHKARFETAAKAILAVKVEEAEIDLDDLFAGDEADADETAADDAE